VVVADVVVLANLDPVYVFKLMVPPAISTVSDLKGKRIGITNERSVDATATRSALRRVGLARLPHPGRLRHAWPG
jgi:TRAP-type uncharacterized transport system substrate-binding protein